MRIQSSKFSNYELIDLSIVPSLSQIPINIINRHLTPLAGNRNQPNQTKWEIEGDVPTLFVGIFVWLWIQFIQLFMYLFNCVFILSICLCICLFVYSFIQSHNRLIDSNFEYKIVLDLSFYYQAFKNDGHCIYHFMKEKISSVSVKVLLLYHYSNI